MHSFIHSESRYIARMNQIQTLTVEAWDVTRRTDKKHEKF